jgi:hypothetical protein
MMPGCVSLPHGWGHATATGLSIARRTAGESFNLLSDDGPDALEPLSGMARLTSIDVECEPARRETTPERNDSSHANGAATG